MAALDADGLQRLLFARPVCRRGGRQGVARGRRWVRTRARSGGLRPNANGTLRGLRTTCAVSCEQVEQGLWFVFGEPFWLREALLERRLPLESRERCVRAMIRPFRDYYLPREASFSGSVFFMWWDLALSRIAGQPSEIDEVAVAVIGQVLQLPAKGCQFAALHGAEPSPSE